MDTPTDSNLSTQQVKENNKNNNPEGKGGFADHPENRNPGGWDPKHTFSYQMNRFKAMTIQELEDWNKNTSKKERTVAEDLAYRRVFNAQAKLDEFKEVADRTEGRAQQTIKHQGGISLSIDKIAQDIEDLITEDESTTTISKENKGT